ncbi:MAG: acyl-CoA thioesterase [Anaerolineae bacterium]|nr:acyl-CoA thioesterase [Anaerolineae bacterium]
MPPPDVFVAETSFHVRYAETDAMGIIHHASYIIYFEEGRSSYARQRGASYADFERQGFVLAVTEIHARYVKAVRYDQRITVRSWLAEIKSRTVTFEYEIVDAETGDLFVTGHSKHICLNSKGQISILPENWRGWTLS